MAGPVFCLLHRAARFVFSGGGPISRQHYAQRWAFVKTIVSYALALFAYALALLGHLVRQPTL
jgi:hypothetical protein